MSKEKTDRAEGDKQEKADKTERDRAKTARKIQEKADKAEKDRVAKVRKAQEKADKDEKDRARQGERTRMFDEVLSGMSAHSKGCCEPCNFHVKTNDGKYQPCKLGHEDSGPNKEICADCTDTRYHPKK